MLSPGGAGVKEGSLGLVGQPCHMPGLPQCPQKRHQPPVRLSDGASPESHRAGFGRLRSNHSWEYSQKIGPRMETQTNRMQTQQYLGEGSQNSGRESERGTDSSSPDTGAGTKHSWPTRRSAVQWDCASPGFGFAQWPHARQCWFQSSCTERRDQGCPEAPFSTHIRQLLIKAPSVSRAQEHRQARAVQQGRSPAAALP